MILLIIGLVLGFLLGARISFLLIFYSAETGKPYKGRFKIIDLNKINQ